MSEALNATTASTSVDARAGGVTHEGDLVGCPECGSPAIVEWTDSMASTSGPIEHLKIRCVRKHWYLLPAYQVPGAGAHAA